MRHRDLHDRADRDITAFLVTTGITALIIRVANAMYYEGMPGAWVPATTAFALAAVSAAWLCWRLREYERARRR